MSAGAEHLHHDDTPAALSILADLFDHRERPPAGWIPTERGAWVDWEALNRSWVSATEKAAVHIARGCAIAERYGGLPFVVAGSIRSAIDDLAWGWTTTPDPGGLTVEGDGAWRFVNPVGLDLYETVDPGQPPDDGGGRWWDDQKGGDSPALGSAPGRILPPACRGPSERRRRQRAQPHRPQHRWFVRGYVHQLAAKQCHRLVDDFLFPLTQSVRELSDIQVVRRLAGLHPGPIVPGFNADDAGRNSTPHYTQAFASVGRREIARLPDVQDPASWLQHVGSVDLVAWNPASLRAAVGGPGNAAVTPMATEMTSGMKL